MAGPSTLLVDGHDLRTAFAGVTVYGDMNLFAPGKRRGSDDTIPGRRGQLGAPGLQLDAYEFSVFVDVEGATEGQRIARWHAVASVLNGVNQDGLVTLTRYLVNADDTGTDAYTAAGRFVSGLSLALFNATMGRAELVFVNLDGAWRRTSDGVLIIP